MKTLLSILLALSIGQIVQAGTVSGIVLYQGDSTRPINEAIVTLKDTDNNLFATYTTGPNGYYEFLNVPAGTYHLRGTKLTPGVGVTMLDATLVFLHILGYYPFNEIQELAADVTGNGIISMADYLSIVRHVVRGTPFEIGEWVFLNEVITVTNQKTGNPGGLTGSSSGDVGGVFVPGTRGLEVYPMANNGTIKVSANEQFEISILTNEVLTLTGTGLIIDFPSDIITVESVDFPMEGYDYEVDGNQLRLGWNDPTGNLLELNEGNTLITLHCRTTPGFGAGMKAKITLNGNTSLISRDYTEIKDARLQAPVIEYTLPSLRLSNYPNPFAASTTLSYYLPESGTVTIALYDHNGRVVREYNQGELAAGYHTLAIEGSGLTPGSYFCKLNLSGSNTQTIRLLKTH